MSVVSCTEVPGGDGTIATDQNRYETTRLYKLVMSSGLDNIETIRLQGPAALPNPLPKLWDQHPSNPNLRVRQIAPRNSDGPKVHTVSVKYDNAISAGTMPQLAEEFKPNPLERRLLVQGKSIHATLPLTSVWRLGVVNISETPAVLSNGNFPDAKVPFHNTADDPIEGQERDADQFGWDVEWNIEEIPFFLANLQNTINDAPFSIRGLSLPKWTCLFRDFSHSDLLFWRLSDETPPVYYFKIRFGIYYRKDTWIRQTPNLGYQEKSLVTTNKRRRLVDEFGVPIPSPAPLDPDGHKISDYSPETILYCLDSPYDEADWSDIPSLA